MSSQHRIARRTFLQGLAGVATPWALNLAAMGEAAAFSGDGYKALVCIFLYGGNDNGNTVVPYDAARHAAYTQARSTLAVPRAQLAATALGTRGLPSGVQYALSPHLSALKPLFDDGRLAVQLNVGPLVAPTTLAQYRSGVAPLPPKLFSHNDQQSVWQSASAEGAVRGWGGHMGDLALPGNGNNALFTCMSVTGNAVFLSGASALAYQVGTGGPVAIRALVDTNNAYYHAAAGRQVLRTLITETRAHVLENELNVVARRSIDSQATLSSAIAGSAGRFDSLLPDEENGTRLSLNQQLKMVARLIDARARLGLKRQVFMVSLGGFDTHDQLTSRHPVLLRQLGAAMRGFQAALDTLGVAPLVTTFTASEFGRTITSNGDGSDHGWGSEHFVMGGAVQGGAFYGKPPSAVVGGAEDVGQGRYIPSTSVDQYAATLASWFGLSEQEMPQIAPNLRNFSQRNLGFMTA